MKSLLAVVCALALVGCGNRQTEPLEGTITKVVQETTEWGCIGTDKYTILRFPDNRVAMLCGEWGDVGTKVKGCWETGNYEASSDGFRLVCRK